MLAERLERLSADSLWARRASGCRRSLLKALDQLEGGTGMTAEQADELINDAMSLLTRAAQEIPEIPPDSNSNGTKHPSPSNL